jgi:hypothetical protein
VAEDHWRVDEQQRDDGQDNVWQAERLLQDQSQADQQQGAQPQQAHLKVDAA